jgi:hypothetical protein
MSLSLYSIARKNERAEGRTLCPGNGARGCSGRTPAEPYPPTNRRIVSFPEQ